MLRIGISQIHNYFELEKNLGAIFKAIEMQAARGADLVLFPECALSGYNTGIMKLDHSRLLSAVSAVQSLARGFGVAIALPTPWPIQSGGLHNAVLFINERGEIEETFRKVGLQKGEERLFAKSDPHGRIFTVKGHRIGVIICVETSHGPWDYLSQNAGAELIFWPGFYAQSPEELSAPETKSESDAKVRSNHVGHWRVPLLHVNCASSPEAQFWPGKLFGGSGVTCGEGREVIQALRSEEDYLLVEFLGKTIRPVRL